MPFQHLKDIIFIFDHSGGWGGRGVIENAWIDRTMQIVEKSDFQGRGRLNRSSTLFEAVINRSFFSKWFEPRSISSSCSVIVRVSVVLKRTVGDSD